MADIDGNYLEALSYNSWTQAYSAPVVLDTTAPTITIISPPVGTVINATDEIIADIEDETSLQTVILMVKYLSSSEDRVTEVIWDGTAFRFPFANSTAAATTDGLRFTIRRTGGWKSSPTIEVYAVDASGNEAT